MKKYIVIISAVLMLSGCSMSSRDWATVSSAMDTGDYATGECEYYDSSNDYLGSSDDVRAYAQLICNNVYITLNSSNYSKEYKCKIRYEGIVATRYIKPGGSAEITVDPRARSSKDNYLRCEDYNVPAKVSTDNPSFKTKVVEGYSYVSLKNSDDFRRVCEFLDSDDNLIKKGVIIEANSWSEWVDFDNGLKTNCIRDY